jgi:hypothetical protein
MKIKHDEPLSGYAFYASLRPYSVVRNEQGDAMYRGPRVRMGVHVAAPGEWRRGVHEYTHHTAGRCLLTPD